MSLAKERILSVLQINKQNKIVRLVTDTEMTLMDKAKDSIHLYPVTKCTNPMGFIIDALIDGVKHTVEVPFLLINV